MAPKTNCLPSGAVDRLTSLAIVALLVAGCAEAPSPAPPSASCPGGPECPAVAEVVKAGGCWRAGETRWRGVLSPKQRSASYVFTLDRAARLQWRYTGPMVHMVLEQPGGEAIGPGLPPSILLPAPGRYVLSVSSNLMAEGIDGPFELTLCWDTGGQDEQGTR